MRPLKLDEDIRPLSEFRAEIASFVKQVNDTKRPLVLTQHGRGAVVIVDIAEYAAMRERSRSSRTSQLHGHSSPPVRVSRI